MRYRLAELEVDAHGRRVSVAGQPVHLTWAEMTLLLALIEADGKPVSRDTLYPLVMRRPYVAPERTLDQALYAVRHKLPGFGALIQSVRGIGYWMPAPERITDPEPHSAAGKTEAPCPSFSSSSS